jgi:LAO/AO transport system kinase
VRPRIATWAPRVLTCSALLGEGIAAVWSAVDDFRLAVAETLLDLRAGQNRDWMWSEVTDSLLDALSADADAAALAHRLETEVAAGTTAPTTAARAVVQAFLDGRHT